MLLQVKGLMQVIVKLRTEKIFVHISIIHQTQTSFWEAQNIVHLCNSTLKRNELKVFISLKERKLASWSVLQVAKAHFRYPIWFVISEKSITRYTFPHHGGHARMYQKSQETRHTKILCARISNSFSP